MLLRQILGAMIDNCNSEKASEGEIAKMTTSTHSTHKVLHCSAILDPEKFAKRFKHVS